ncbi:MAG: helix-turn-helix transcriptional regulator [Streptomycetaceae bacterium]|nr:helix-turn-helix transcriptional regulator [Streptomycetaceae bacterium]NUS54223.1 helix-turn-helix transcriptional regulator [Streptomycetaceae bacterium]
MSTRDDMVLAAERLFARFGVDGVSLRQIGAAAGQRNVAAAQYHFGDKQTLLQAIYDFRLAAIDARRRELLDAVRASGSAGDVRALVEVLVVPLAEQAAAPGSHYVRFLNRMCDHQGRALLPLSEVGPVNSALEVGHLILDALGGAAGGNPLRDDPRARQRGELAGRLIIAGLADLEHRLRPDTDGTADVTADAGSGPDAGLELDPAEYADGVVDAVVAVLTAPVPVRRRPR